MTRASILEEVSMGRSSMARRISNAIFVAACVAAPAVFWALSQTQAVGTSSAATLVISALLTLGWLLVALDVRNFACGKPINLSPVFLDARAEHTLFRWMSLTVDLACLGIVGVLTIRVLAAP